MVSLAITFFRHSSRWWLYFLTYALLAAIVGSIVFEATQGVSRPLSRVRLWLGLIGIALFFTIVVMQPSATNPASLASFASGAFVCTLLFFGWLGLQRRR